MLLRFAMNLYKGKIEGEAFTNQIFRESSALRASAEVWSDVASSMGLGFRYGDGGPLLHGDLASGARLEIGVYEGKLDGQYRTAARVTAAEPMPGRVVVRPHTPITRALGHVLRAPAGVPDGILAAYLVRAEPRDAAARRLGPSMCAVLEEQRDRAAELYADPTSITLVLEGIELQHDRMEKLIAALEEGTSAATKGTSPG